MNKLALGDVSKTDSELPAEASNSLYQTNASSELPHQFGALVKQFACFSSIAVCASALPDSLFM
jgi:hypothetical protein